MFDYSKGYTLITGASYGLGAEFAMQLAQKGSNLVLVARSMDKLYQLKQSLNQYNIKVLIIRADLSKSEDIQKVIDKLKQEYIQINLLINNAGIGSTGSFYSHTLEDYTNQIDLNNKALVRLSYEFLAHMINKKYGGIINIASSVSFQPIPYMAVYASTKAFVLSFSEALGYEVKNSNIKILASCPGTTRTNFFDNSKSDIKRKKMDEPSIVVKNTIKAFEKGKSVCFPGSFFVAFNSFMIRFIPRSTVVKMTGVVVKALGFSKV